MFKARFIYRISEINCPHKRSAPTSSFLGEYWRNAWLGRDVCDRTRDASHDSSFLSVPTRIPVHDRCVTCVPQYGFTGFSGRWAGCNTRTCVIKGRNTCERASSPISPVLFLHGGHYARGKKLELTRQWHNSRRVLIKNRIRLLNIRNSLN